MKEQYTETVEENKPFSCTITKVGRKWMNGIREEYPNDVKIAINEVSKNWAVGQYKAFYCKLITKSSRYGHEFIVFPEEEGVLDYVLIHEKIETCKEDLTFWLKLIQKNLKNGKFWYDKGEDKAMYFILKLEQYGYDCTGYRKELEKLKKS